jgi:HK97 family phage portal protein
LELSIKVGNKKFGFTIGGKKAFNQTIDPNNQVIRQLYEKLGFTLNLNPHELKSYVQEGYLTNPHVYTVINKIIRPSAEIPFYLYEKVADKKKEFNRYKSAMDSGDIFTAERFAKKSLKEVTTIKELSKFLETPNEFQTFQEWQEQGMGFHLLTGEEFIYGLAPSGFAEDYFTKLYNMPPQLTNIEIGNWQNPIKGYYLDYFGFSKSDLIEPYKICHIKYNNPNYDTVGSELRGLSPMSPLCKVVKRSNDGYEAQLRILQNGHPIGILSNASDRGTTEEQAREIKRSFRDKYQGAMNKGDVMVTSAQLNWLALGMNSIDMQLLEADKADLESIARVYGVPLPLVLNDASSYNNIKEARKQCWNETRIPLLNKRRDALNRFILPAYKKKYGKDLYFDYDLMAINDLKEDDLNVVNIIEKEIATGIMTPNEGRELRNRDMMADPLMDSFYFRNLTPIDQPKTPPTNG